MCNADACLPACLAACSCVCVCSYLFRVYERLSISLCVYVSMCGSELNKDIHPVALVKWENFALNRFDVVNYMQEKYRTMHFEIHHTSLLAYLFLWTIYHSKIPIRFGPIRLALAWLGSFVLYTRNGITYSNKLEWNCAVTKKNMKIIREKCACPSSNLTTISPTQMLICYTMNDDRMLLNFLHSLQVDLAFCSICNAQILRIEIEIWKRVKQIKRMNIGWLLFRMHRHCYRWRCRCFCWNSQ